MKQRLSGWVGQRCHEPAFQRFLGVTSERAAADAMTHCTGNCRQGRDCKYTTSTEDTGTFRDLVIVLILVISIIFWS